MERSRHAQLPAQQLRQQRVARGGEGPGGNGRVQPTDGLALCLVSPWESGGPFEGSLGTIDIVKEKDSGTTDGPNTVPVPYYALAFIMKL